MSELETWFVEVEVTGRPPRWDDALSTPRYEAAHKAFGNWSGGPSRKDQTHTLIGFVYEDQPSPTMADVVARAEGIAAAIGCEPGKTTRVTFDTAENIERLLRDSGTPIAEGGGVDGVALVALLGRFGVSENAG